jgi:hypothetical protein
MDRKFEKIGIGLVSGLMLLGFVGAWADDRRPVPTTLDVVVWPESVSVNPMDSLGNCPVEPCSAQLYAVALLSDGSVLCSDARSDSIHPPPWTHEAECNAAAALLDYSLLPQQDTTIVRRDIEFRWSLQPDSIVQAYARIDYHLYLRNETTNTFLFDSAFAHPESAMVYPFGVPGSEYGVWTRAMGINPDTVVRGPSTSWLRFIYPPTDTVITVNLPVPVLPTLVVDTIAGDTIR